MVISTRPKRVVALALGALLASLAAGCGAGVEGGSTQAHTAEAAGPVRS